MDLVLVYSPFCTPASPPYAITRLYSFLKNNLDTMYNIEVLDLNLFFHTLKFDKPLKENLTLFAEESNKVYSQNNNLVVEGKSPEFLEECLNKLLALKPDVVAFSLIYSSQCFYTLSLIKELKKLNIKTIVGGPAVNSKLIEEADYFLKNEIELCDFITGEKVYDDGVKLNKLNYNVVLDYSIYESDYFVPERVIPLKTTTCCFYQQCTFCTHHGKGMYQEFDLEDIKQSIIKSNSKFVFFIDDMFTKKRILELAEIIKPLNVKWMCQLKPLKEFDEETLKILFNSGLRLIIWGVESGCDRILKLMKKGTNVKDMDVVLENSKKVGISNVTYIMFGFPTENENEFIETIDFLKGNELNIDLISTSVFGLQKESYIYSHFAEFDIENIFEEERTVLEPKITYVMKKGLSNQEAKKLRDKYRKTLEKINKFPKVYNFFREWMLVDLK
ncbi:MAG: B12-binding domain-containing radical SAM protein [Candidatus Nanoarchaeia archaeon]|nr:B12-binding domain-containing radical SAM protein [Candidatus Nanoarchaeia archaeon]